MPRLARPMIACAALAALAGGAHGSVVVSVPGTANPWLAGQPEGTVARYEFDSAPANSPVQAPIYVEGGVVFQFAAKGSVNNQPGVPTTSPDGGVSQSRMGGAELGVADLVAPVNSLVGIFLGNELPDPANTPARLHFETIGTNFVALTPMLHQPFFIGDGVDASGVVQSFIAPAGATRLFLGTMDGFQWSNNSGGFVVSVVPTPGAAALLGVAGVLALRRRRA